MNTPVRRTTLRAVAASVLGAALLASTALVAVLATPAGAVTIPPWETGSPPAVSPNEVGGLTFYNSAGQVITGGTITDTPIAAYVQGNTALQTNGTKAELTGFTPVIGVAPGAWNGVPFFNSAYPNSAAPGGLATSTLPLYTGVSGYSISNLTTQYPNTDTTNDGYAGIYVLRLQAFQSPNGYSSTYDSADISVSGSTWSLLYAPTVGTTTTLDTPQPASPQNSGTAVTLTAHVADVSAPGTVQFFSGSTPVGNAQTVASGTASLITSALPVGTDSLTAVFTPTTGAAFVGSTSNTVPFEVDAANTVPGAPTIGTATAGDHQATVTFTPPVSNGGSTITGYTVTATDTTNGANGGQTAPGTSSPIIVTGLTNGDSYTFKVTATNGVGTGLSSAASNAVTPATVPGAPTIGTATAGNAAATVTFTAPASNGGAPITSYTVTATDTTNGPNGGQTASGATSPITVTGLTNGDHYTFTVTATNDVGPGAASAASNSVIPEPVAPGAPTIGTATAGDHQATVTFTPPVSNGGSTITGYTVTATDTTNGANGGQTAPGTSSPIIVTGLTNGDSYTFKVTATNGVGTGLSSAASNAVTPATVPGAPTIGTATAGQGQATVPFTPPVSNGGAPVTSYTVTATDTTNGANGGQTASGASSPITVTGLTNGDHYTFTVTATNDVGPGAPSAASNSVTPEATVPGAPTGVSAVAGNAQATVSFGAPASNGGSTITGYTVTATDTTNGANGGQTGTGSSPITVTGLTNGDSYTFAVTATNGVGTGPASVTNAVTPEAGPQPPAPPAGATSSQGASSASPSGTATAAVTGLSATGTGVGALTVATYSGNPAAGTVSGGTGVYYDVAVSSGNAFGSLTITISDLGPGGQSIDWWNGSAWVPFSDQTFNAATDSVTITVNATTSPTLSQLTGTEIAVSSNPAPSLGYWEVASDGGIFAFGGAGFYGSQGGKPLNKPIVGIASTPSGNGYWEVASDGGIFSFGDATFYGSEGGKPLNKPIVGIATTPSGKGYWEVASDGGIFSFGDATFYGSEGGKPLNKPIVGIATTPSGKGYWEVASDGGIFAFGDATFYGSEGGKPLNKPIVGIASTPSGNGYWEVASDGGIFSFGDAGFYGSQGGKPLNQPIVGIAPTSTGNGYWEVASDGGIFNYGDAGFYGSQGGKPLNKPIVGIAGV